MNIVLIGFMASGKTAVGRRLAQRLGYGFLDTDQFIESELGCTISDLFAIQGEDYFRNLESRLAERLARLDTMVVATGGGLPVTPGNLERLRRAGIVVFLKASLEDILKRLERDTRRPKVQGGDLRQTVTDLLERRLPVYEQADLVIPTHGKSVNRVSGEIIQRLGQVPRYAQSTAPGETPAKAAAENAREPESPSPAEAPDAG